MATKKTKKAGTSVPSAAKLTTRTKSQPKAAKVAVKRKAPKPVMHAASFDDTKADAKQAMQDVVTTRRQAQFEAAEKEVLRSVAGSGPHSAPHGIVRARAGTGKTFTLVLGVANIYRDKVLPDSWNVKKGAAERATLWGKVEKTMGFKVEPSPQQRDVWEYMAKSHPRTICYVAFNASIVEEFSEKYAWLVAALDSIGIKLTFSTIHSLGNAACRQAYNLRGFKSVNQYRVTDLLSAFWQKDLREVWKEKAETIDAIKELVGLCKLTLAHHDNSRVGVCGPGNPQNTIPEFEVLDDELEAIAIHYGITAPDMEEVYTAVRHILNECRKVEQGGRIDFNDMIWLPVVNNLKVEQFDLLLVDEAQDLNRCQQELVMKAGKRFIVVGDERQAIYGFAGADTDSIDRMKVLLEASYVLDGKREVGEMKLTMTRRCGKAIVEKARQLVPDFEAHPDNGEGRVCRVNMEALEEDSGGEQDVPGGSAAFSLGKKDMVLCRVNAPLVGLAFRMLKAGKRVNIKGRDIGVGLKAFIKKSKQKEVGEFLVWLDMFQQQESERIKRRRNVDTEALVTLEDKCLCLRTFCEGALTLKDVYKAIDEVFKGKICPKCGKHYDEGMKVCYEDACAEGRQKRRLVKPEGTLLSSVHRAKGLEAKRVFILRPDLMPHPKAKSEWERGQEANLQYVAETRAIEELVYVDGKETSDA